MISTADNCLDNFFLRVAETFVMEVFFQNRLNTFIGQIQIPGNIFAFYFIVGNVDNFLTVNREIILENMKNTLFFLLHGGDTGILSVRVPCFC